MSRGGFRVRVSSPRPASAWAMVTVASAMLWVTGQLDAWALVAEVSALLLSLWRRTRPFRWQSNAIVLNLGMLAITCATIVVSLRGAPSTIPLAHFAALTQGLQLLDARPRRTEFLLVALALFQVVLAANLTDSVFFTPMLVAFVLATIWTLLVHTLHSEALEAGEAREIPRAITPGLVRTTLLASGLSVLLAMALFVMLPRLRTSVFTGSNAQRAQATAGFSDSVAFGELGKIRQDRTVVLRAETLEGDVPAATTAYWRGLAFDTFDGVRWSITPSDRSPVAGSAEGGVSLGTNPTRTNLVQRIVREPVAAGVLFAIGEVRELQGTIRNLERDQSGGLYAVGQADERIRYVVRTQTQTPTAADLARDRALPPSRRGERYLQLPPLTDATRALAREITAAARDDAERVRALEQYLIRNGRYSDTPMEPDPGDARSPVEAFLLAGLAGHCEYFASGMVLLARTLGIPARLVNGFAGGHENGIGGFVEISRSDAHAWVEVHFEKSGWVRYDPTPPDLRRASNAALAASMGLRDLASALELWWFQRVVGFDRADQIGVLKRAWVSWRDLRRPGTSRTRDESGPARWQYGWRAPEREAWILLLCAAACAVSITGFVRRVRRRARVSGAYARGLSILARRGVARAPSTTARAFVAEVRARAPEATARAFAQLTEAYLASRFGGYPEADATQWLRGMRQGFRRAPRTA